MAELLRKNKALATLLYNRDLDKQSLALLAAHLERIHTTRDEILMRQEKRKVGIFKFQKKTTPSQILSGTIIVLIILAILLFIHGTYQRAKEYFDEEILYSVTETSKDLLFMILLFTVFNIVSMHNLFVDF